MRVFIADDQAEFRAGLRDLLGTADDVEVVGEAANGREAVQAVPRIRPDIILMDIGMPVLDGIAATAAILAESPDACVLMLTTFDEDRLVRNSILAGASGYLLKGTPLEDMIAIFRLALRGYTAIGKGERTQTQRSGDERIRHLSPRERGILELVGEGYTNRDIAGTLFLTEGTVRNYITQILGKLALRHRTEAALFWRTLQLR